jgi:hypothetical protein
MNQTDNILISLYAGNTSSHVEIRTSVFRALCKVVFAARFSAILPTMEEIDKLDDYLRDLDYKVSDWNDDTDGSLLAHTREEE